MTMKGKMEAAALGAKSCLDVLSDRDFVGILSFGNRANEVFPLSSASQREEISDAIDAILQAPENGGTLFSDTICQAGVALASLEQTVARKHLVLITDGNPGDRYEDYLPYIEENLQNGITMSIITIGDFPSNMEAVAEAGGGAAYRVGMDDLRNVPAMMQMDLELQARVTIAYGEEFSLTVKERTNALNGIDEDAIPNLNTYYGAVAKEGASVVLMGAYTPIYVQWSYGSGKVGSLLSELHGERTKQFLNDAVGKALILNLVSDLFPEAEETPQAVLLSVDSFSATVSARLWGQSPELLSGMENGTFIKAEFSGKCRREPTRIGSAIV